MVSSRLKPSAPAPAEPNAAQPRWLLAGGECMPDTPEAHLRLAAATSMASTLAHEVSQPLTAAASALAACARRLRGLGDDYADVQAMLDHASRETVKAGDLIRRTRNFVVSGRVSADRENLRSMVERALLRLGEHRDHVGLTTEVAPDLFVIADRIPLEQALANLLLRACAALEGRDDGWIELEAKSDGEMILLSVVDNGPGLAAPDGQGAGFALAVASLIAEAHGGRLDGADLPEGGARFELSLPAAE